MSSAERLRPPSGRPLGRTLLLLVALVVDGKILGIALVIHAHLVDVAPQHTHTHGVKGRDPRLGESACADQLIDALCHLAGGFIGERDCQNRFRQDSLIVDQVRDAVGDHARLSRPGAGQDEQRSIGGFDGFALFGIELGEKRHFYNFTTGESRCFGRARLQPTMQVSIVF